MGNLYYNPDLILGCRLVLLKIKAYSGLEMKLNVLTLYMHIFYKFSNSHTFYTYINKWVRK